MDTKQKYTLKVAVNCPVRLPMIRSNMITVTRPIVSVKSRWYAFIRSSSRKEKWISPAKSAPQSRLTPEETTTTDPFWYEAFLLVIVLPWIIVLSLSMMSHRCWAFCHLMVCQFGLTSACVAFLVVSFAESFVIDYKPKCLSLSTTAFDYTDRQYCDK